MEQHGPEIKKIWSDEAFAKMTDSEGNLWGVPRSMPYATYPIYVRGEFLELYGLEPPTTLDELETVLEVFKEKDPAGGGSTIVLATSLDHLRWCTLGLFTENGHSMWMGGDGKIKPVYLHPGYKEWLAKFHDWYERGLIYEESFVVPASQIRTLIYQGKVAATAYWYSAITIGITPIRENFPDATYVKCKLTGPMGLAQTIRPGGTSGGLFPAKSDVAWAAMKVVNWLHEDPENWIVGYNGMKDIHWQYVNKENYEYELIGKKQYFEDYWVFAGGVPLSSRVFMVDPKLKMHSTYLREEIRDYSWGKKPFDLDIVWDETAIKENVPAMSDLTRLWDEESVKFLMGQRPLSEYDDFIDEMYKVGVDQWIDEYTRQYKLLMKE
jgi:ABC-type glycerol-3-phosphate transport system substrate-binding protein